MSKQEIAKKIIPILKKQGVKKAALFGSQARGEATKKSDVDLLVEFNKNKEPGLFGFVGFKLELEEKLRRKVDLLTYNAIHPLLRNTILKDQKIIYEKRS
ncbi:MAG: nucleotidyltransferase family protein [Candidatus Gribaldobacteria bacterium]|nr:nucleotidyltransferase family protein [Candidatus Gribaldobacteria bacterium]